VPNSIKSSGGGLALQVTKPARQAELVTEASDGNATRLADVLVYGFDNLLLVVDADQVSVSDRAELVSTIARDTNSIHEGQAASLEIAGNGYQVQLPGCRAAGFQEGTSAPTVTRSGVLLIHDETAGRLARDVATIRKEQTN
jgi:hypothetical protein